MDLAMELLTAARPVMNEANVFPVADSDTGTNLCLTLGDARRALDALAPAAPLDDALRSVAQGALMGARGNSGIILSEYLRGFALGVAGGPVAPVSPATPADQPRTDGAGTAAVVAGLLEAARCAYDAVGIPREGTILTAAVGAAQAAQDAEVTGLREVVDRARAGAQHALERSVHELDVLRSAGLLDAGAYGLVLILDALGLALGGGRPAGDESSTVDGHPATGSPGAAPVSVAAGMIVIMDSLAVADSDAHVVGTYLVGTHPAARDDVAHAHDDRSATDGEFEVMFVVELASADRLVIDAIGPTLRERLLRVGDSVVVVGGADDSAAALVTGTWQVHVHTDDPLDALRVAGGWEQRQIVIRSLPNQVAARAGGAQPRHGVVACTASPGLVTDLARSGAVVVLRGTAPIGAGDLRRGALETTAAHVTLLPADATTLTHARTLAAAPGSGDLLPSLDVVDSVSDLHVVAAMSEWAMSGWATPESATFETATPPLTAMRAAVAAVRATTVDGSDPAALETSLVGLLDDVRSGSGAVLTVLAGDLVPAGVVSHLTAEANRRHPGIEVVALSSGRRSTAVVLGVEA